MQEDFYSEGNREEATPQCRERARPQTDGDLVCPNSQQADGAATREVICFPVPWLSFLQHGFAYGYGFTVLHNRLVMACMA